MDILRDIGNKTSFIICYKRFLSYKILFSRFTKLSFSLYLTFHVSFFSIEAQHKGFKHLHINNGLSQSWVRCIHQDSIGFMWFGTDNGLNRYDGKTFQIYKHNPSNIRSISSSRVNVLHEDKKGNFWIGTLNGLNLFDRRNNSFISKGEWPQNAITSIEEDESGNLWLGTNEKLVFLDVNTNKTIEYKGGTDSISVSSWSVNKLFIDRNKNLWVATLNGLNVIDPQKKIIKRYSSGKNNNLLSNDIRSLWEDRFGRLWIGSVGGIDIFTNSADLPDIGNFIHIQHNNLNKKSLSNGTILTLYSDSKNRLFIGTENGGVDIYNLNNLKKELFEFEHNINDPDNPASLSNNSIYSILEDNQENIWIGTHGDGINILNKENDKFEIYQKSPNSSNSLHNNIVNAFFEDNEYLWIGTEGGLTRYDKRTKKYSHFENDPENYNSLGANSVLAIYQDKKKNLWVGGMGSGLNLFNKKTNSFIHYYSNPNDPNSLRTNNIFSILESKKGTLWIGVVCGGLAKFDPQKKTFEYYQGNSNPNDFDCIKGIVEGRNGNLWLITSNSLDCFDPETEKFTRYTHNSDDSNSLSSNWVFSIFEDSNANIWVGTDAGLNLFNSKLHNFTNYQVEDGLPDNAIKSIEQDNNGNLWIGTDKGISKFIDAINIPSKPIFKNYTADDGLQGNEFRKRASFKNKDGKLLFGGINGFNAFYPDSIKENKYLPKVVFTDFSIFNKPVSIGNGSPLEQDISVTKVLTLLHSHSVVTIRFSALSYISPEKNQYAYKLSGFETDWNYVGTKNEATYTNLSPGKYEFTVKACNNDEIWNDKETTLIINILPPWWKTWWARAIFYLLAIGLALYAYYLRIAFYRSQQKKLTKLVKERTRELEESTAYLEEKQEEINMQKEELIAQRNTLEDTNKILTDQKEKINNQNEKLTIQKETLENTNKLIVEKQDQIIQQNKELDKHRYELESLVEERTRDLIDAKLKAEESDRLKSAFLANMSHEIRTPMNAIIGFSSLLKELDIPSDEKEKMIDVIIGNSESLLSIINDILDLSMIQSNQIKLYPVSTQVVALLKEIQSSFQIEANKKNILLKLDLTDFEQDTIVDCDKLRVKQVLVNLVNNAIKFTNTGEIIIGIQKTDDLITFYVKDSGIGIPENTGNAIFERFLKIENTTKLYGGTGLGLSICKSLVSLWNGNIWYQSTFNKGATFYFTVPYTKQRKKTTDKEMINIPTQSPSLEGKIVLIAEDQENNYLLLKTFLIKTKASVVWAKNGKEAINYALNNHVDLVLMDIKMPDINGLDAMKQIKKVKPELPVVAQTAYAFENEKNEFINQGFDGYLVKPLRIEELMDVLSNYQAK